MNEGQNPNSGLGGAGNRSNFGAQVPQGGFSSGGQPMTPMQAPISSGTGDIVLSQEKKSHKKVVIAIVVAVLVIGGLAALLFLRFGGGGNAGVSVNTKQAFYRYANYLLYGEDSDAALEEKNEETESEGEDESDDYIDIYTLDEVVADADATGEEGEILAGEYFAKAEQLWDTFYGSLGSGVNAELKEMVESYKEDFEFTKIFVEAPVLDNDVFAEKFVTMSRANLNKWIQSYYMGFLNSGYEKIKEYGQNGIQYYGLYADYLEQVKGVGCLSDSGEMVAQCEGLATVEMNDEMLGLMDEMMDYRNEAILATTDDCWTIAKMLNGEKVDTEGEE